MMEDISPAEQGDQLAGCGVAEAELVIDQAVGLHAPTWGELDELAGFDWLQPPDAERAETLGMMYSMCAPGSRERYGGVSADADLDLGASLVAVSEVVQAIAAWSAANGGYCVVHAEAPGSTTCCSGRRPTRRR